MSSPQYVGSNRLLCIRCHSSSGSVRHTGPWHVWSASVAQLHTWHLHRPQLAYIDSPYRGRESLWAALRCAPMEACTMMRVLDTGHVRHGGLPCGLERLARGPGMPGCCNRSVLGGFSLGCGGFPVTGPGLLSTSPHERRDLPGLPHEGYCWSGSRRRVATQGTRDESL